jgi:hypothetical protein
VLLTWYRDAAPSGDVAVGEGAAPRAAHVAPDR